MHRKRSLLLLSLPMTLVAALIGLSALSARPAAKAASDTPDTSKRKTPLTFARDVAPILFQNCVTCHRPGDIGPFSLLTYDDAKKRARQLAEVTQSRFMPPWHADSHGEFANERRLTTEQIDTIKEWVAAGAPEGDRAEMPALPSLPPVGWKLGKPDMILQPEKDYVVSAEGTEVYAYFVLPTHFPEDRYLSGVEFRPGNNRVVHHIIAMLDTTGTARKVAAQRGNGYSDEVFGGFIPSGSLGGWAPGNLPVTLPDDVGILLPKGADVVLQIHYHKDGKVETDRTQVGLHFARKPIDKRLRVMPLFGFLNIPAGDSHYVVRGFPWPITDAMSVRQVMPHMHLLGQTMNVFATLPNGEKKSLITTTHWDFNWQTAYVYKDPPKLPKGSLFGMTATFDNSVNNPNNPNHPPRLVTWGEATTEEMCVCFLWYTYDREHLQQGVAVHDMMDNLDSVRGAIESFYRGMNQHLNAKPATP